MKNFFIIFFALLASCKQPSEKISDTFVVPVLKKPMTHAYIRNEPPLPPPPIRAYYMKFNFIVDTSGMIFYFQRRLYKNDVVYQDWNTPPDFINLQPEDLVYIPENSIEDFIELNVLAADSNDRYVSIASIKDTIKSLGLAKIIAVISGTSSHVIWLFRKATQEEAVVLYYKKRRAYYFSDGIKWDSSKIRFTPKVAGDIKSTPPKVKEK